MSDVTLNSSVGGEGRHGGLVGQTGAVNITGCVFSGKMLTTGSIDTGSCGGIIGMSNKNCTITDCVYDPAPIESDEKEVAAGSGEFPSGTFYTGKAAAVTNCYYTRTLGTAQGKQAYAITEGENVTIVLSGTETDEDVANSNTAYMQFTILSGSTTYTTKVYVKTKEGERNATTATVGSKTYYVFKCNVAAKEMTSQIKAQIIDGKSQGTEYTYSVKEYADYLLNHTEGNAEYTAAAPLVKAMLNYGAYSQSYFGTHIDSLANASLDETDKSLGEVTITHSNAAVTNLSAGVTFEGASLSLKSETTLSLFFKNTSESDVTFKLGDNTIVPIDNNGYLQIKITGIKAKQLSSDFTVTIGESGSVTYSPMNYCQLVLSGNYTNAHKDVVKALYKYSQAADNYFNVS